MESFIAPEAQSDIDSILAWTEENFGPQTLKRYERLIAAAIEDVAADPERAGSTPQPEIAEGWRTYHLYCSRKKAGRPGERVRRPRHFLLYRVTDANVVEIGRVLHDSMELHDHLPDDYRGSPE
jgi:toxin ParE1/3/4